ELARLIRLDPEVPLWPVEDFRFPMPLPGEPWFNRPDEELVAFALRGRPEQAENRALVEAALARIRAAKVRPLLPNVAPSCRRAGVPLPAVQLRPHRQRPGRPAPGSPRLDPRPERHAGGLRPGRHRLRAVALPPADRPGLAARGHPRPGEDAAASGAGQTVSL